MRLLRSSSAVLYIGLGAHQTSRSKCFLVRGRFVDEEEEAAGRPRHCSFCVRCVFLLQSHSNRVQDHRGLPRTPRVTVTSARSFLMDAVLRRAAVLRNEAKLPWFLGGAGSGATLEAFSPLIFDGPAGEAEELEHDLAGSGLQGFSIRVVRLAGVWRGPLSSHEVCFCNACLP